MFYSFDVPLNSKNVGLVLTFNQLKERNEFESSTQMTVGILFTHLRKVLIKQRNRFYSVEELLQRIILVG